MNTRATQSRPEAEPPEVTDEMVERACLAFYVDDGWKTNINRAREFMRIALQAAYGQQCAANRSAEVGGDGVAELVEELRLIVEWTRKEGVPLRNRELERISALIAKHTPTPPAPVYEVRP